MTDSDDGPRPRALVSSALAGNFAYLLLETAANAGNRGAIVDSAGVTSYRQLTARALGITESLLHSGIEPGDRAAIYLPDGADAAAAFFGVLGAGAIAVFINDSLRPRQIEHILNHSEARILLTSAKLQDRLSRALATRVQVLYPSTVPDQANSTLVPRIAPDVAQITYTSGSTGLPKGVTLSHGNLWAGTHAVVKYLGIQEDDRIASVLPFSFDYGLNQLFCSVKMGATLVVERSPVPARTVCTLRDRRITVLAAVPPLWLQLLEVRTFQRERFPYLRIMTNSGGRFPTDAVRKLRQYRPDAKLFLMYGLTEAFRSTYLDPEKVDRKPASIGQPVPGADVLVVRKDLTRCKSGEVGELVHRGPTVALGYWNDPDATSRVFRPSPIRDAGTPDAERVVFSGDLVHADHEGDLFFLGRSDKMIKTMGYRVSPDEVVDVLYASRQVVEAIVTSEPDPIRGERIVAYVVLSGAGTLDRLTAYCADEMPHYMHPARIEVRASLDRTHSGKHDITAAATNKQ